MIRQIMKDYFFLQQKSLEASQDDLAIGKDLEDTLLAHQKECVGMAANMIGVNKRIIIIQMGLMPLLLFNPVLVYKEGAYHTSEGCLSLMGSRETVRYKKIRVRFRDSKWQEKELTLEGFTAQICQHELDYLEGILI